MIRTVLVDDEQMARERLRQLLRAFDSVEIVGEAEDGEQAIEKIVELRPDLVLLDIQMPGCSGMDVAASLPSPRPHIVFCTAYDQYAIDAFEINAVDYLLKPVSRARLAKAIERVAAPSADRGAELAGARPERFLAKRGNRYVVVPQHDVLCFVSQDGLTQLRTREHEYWMDPTLGDLESRLDPALFFRISRAALVNVNFVQEVVPLVGGYGEVVLKSGVRLEVSRRRMKELLHVLGGE